MAKYKTGTKPAPETAEKKAREHLLRECPFSSLASLQQVILKRQITADRQTLLNELGEVLTSTCRDPKFTMRVIELLPEEFRATLRIVIAFEFMHKFSLAEIQNELEGILEFFIQERSLLRSALVRLVLAENDDVFFYIVNHLEPKTFYFSIREIRSLADTSEYDCGPYSNPGALWDRNAHFFELVASCGTKKMRHWSAAFVRELFASQ